jgi:hypothetical protein
MSKSNGLGKLYDRLTPEERFSLDVEAHARGDESELRRLVDSCPRRNYTMTDWAFSGRWQTTTEIVLALAVDLGQHMSRLNMIDAIRQVLPYTRVVFHNAADGTYLEGHEAGSRYAWKRAGMAGDPPGWGPLDEEGGPADADEFDPAIDEALEAAGKKIEEIDLMPELLTRMERKTTERAWTIWEAFASFAHEELEVEPEKLIKAVFEPVLTGVEDLKRRRARLGVEPDEQQAAEAGEAFSIAWSKYLQEVRRLSRPR